jgi:SNF2 family DNA or RNA helicase
VERTLPPKHETILFIGMSTLQKKLYRDILQRDIEAIRGTSGSRTAILNIVMQVRQEYAKLLLTPVANNLNSMLFLSLSMSLAVFLLQLRKCAGHPYLVRIRSLPIRVAFRALICFPSNVSWPSPPMTI